MFNDMLGGNTQGLLPGDWLSFSSNDAANLGQAGVALTGISQTQKQQLVQLLMQGGIITPTVALGRETVNGMLMNHYQFAVNQSALQTALAKAYTIVSGQQPTDAQMAVLSQGFSSFSITNGEVWIGVWDKMPHRIVFTLKGSGDAAAVQSLAFDISLDSFNKGVSIIAPSVAKPLLTILQGAKNAATDAHINAGLSSVIPQSMLYYSVKRSYTGLCDATNGLKNVIAGLGSQAAYCKSTAKTFAVAAPLTATNQFACVDVSGTVVDLPNLPTGTVCK